jgi:hypothetical protein
VAADDHLVRPNVDPDGPLERIFGGEEERKGWGRASIRLGTRPQRRFPRLTQADLLLPNRQNPLRLAGDCLAVGVIVAVLTYFPLLLVAISVTVDMNLWIAAVDGAAGLAAALYVFFRAWSPDTRDLDRY